MPSFSHKVHKLAATLGAVCALQLSACEERERQKRQYRSDPAELRVALASTDQRAVAFEVLDLIAGTEDARPEKYPGLLAELREILAGDDPILAAKAGDVLARWGDSPSAPGLVALLHDSDRWVRASAGASLAILDDPSVVDQVAEATLDPDENVRAQACRTIAEIGAPLGPRAHNLVVRRLADSAPSVRAAALEALGRSGQESDLAAVRAGLDDPHPGVVVAACHAVGRRRDHAATGKLLELLRTGDQAQVTAAAEALGRLADPATIDALLVALQHPDTIVRGEVARALTRIGEPRAIPALFELSVDEDPLLGTFTAFAVARIYDPRYRDFLLGHATSPDEEKRSAGIFSVALAQDREAIGVARGLLSDPHFTVRIAAAGSLAVLQDRDSASSLQALADNDPHPQVRDAAAVYSQVVYLDGADLVDRMIAGLQHPVREVRLNSATMLTSLNAKRAIPALRTVLNDREELIRMAARGGIKHLSED